MASFYDAFRRPVVDGAGNPVLDADGVPVTEPAPRRWDVLITYGVALKLKSRHQIDLLGEKKDLEKVLMDPIAVLQVLDCACEQQLKDRGMDIGDLPSVIPDMDLAAKMDAAVTEAMIDFFPTSLRTAMQKSYRKVTEAARKKNDLLAQRACQMMDSPEFQTRMEAELDRKVEVAMKKLDDLSETSGTSAGSSPEPAASSCST